MGLLLAAAVQYAFMSSIDHVQANRSARYVMMAVFLWQGAFIGFAVVQWSALCAGAAPRSDRAGRIDAGDVRGRRDDPRLAVDARGRRRTRSHAGSIHR